MKSSNYKYTKLGNWISSPRKIERIIIKKWKKDVLQEEIEIRFKEDEIAKIEKLLKELIKLFDKKEEICKCQQHYIYRLLKHGDEYLAIIFIIHK